MAREYSDLFHLGLLAPNYYLILRIAMRAYELVDILCVDEIANLTARVDPMQWLARQRVPEADASVSCAASTTHHAVLMRRPCDGFDGGLVLIEFGMRL